MCRLYTVNVMDVDSSRTSFTFVIGSPITTFRPPNPPFVNPVIKDTLVANAIPTCNINYDAIDSILITDFTVAGTDSIKLIWTVFQTGTSNNIKQDYLLNGNGIFTFVLDLFCTSRASGSAKAEDQLEIGLASGIEDYEIENVNVYPNPFENQINISVETKSNVTIMDITGRTVYNVTINAGSTTIDADYLNSGIYFITINSSGNTITRKVIKQ